MTCTSIIVPIESFFVFFLLYIYYYFVGGKRKKTLDSEWSRYSRASTKLVVVMKALCDQVDSLFGNVDEKSHAKFATGEHRYQLFYENFKEVGRYDDVEVLFALQSL